METDWILIRYGEIGLKSDYVRRSFEDRLINNIESGLNSRGIDGKVKRGYGRIFVSTEKPKEAVEVLGRTFGIVSFSPCKKIDTDFEGIVEELSDLGKGVIDQEQSFAVRVRRTGDHSFSSKDVEEEAGAEILEDKDVEVDLDNPDEKIMADIRQGQCYIFNQKIDGPGGLPLGTQGRVLSLFRGDCSSFLSTWMMMKRGCSVTVLHGQMEPYAKDDMFKKTQEELEKWSHGSSIEVLGFGLGNKIFKFSEEGEKGYSCALCKRFMHRLAEKVAEETGSEAIITGEYLSNNFGDMKLYDSVTDLPIIRPLIGMNKGTIREKCKDIAGEFILKEEECEARDKAASEVKTSRVEELEEEIKIENLVEETVDEVFEE